MRHPEEIGSKKGFLQFIKPSFSDQSKEDIVIKKFVETLIVVDKSVKNMFDNDGEVERYVKVLFGLVS